MTARPSASAPRRVGRMSHVGLGAVRKALCEFASLRADHFVTSLPSQVTASGFSLMGARRAALSSPLAVGLCRLGGARLCGPF